MFQLVKITVLLCIFNVVLASKQHSNSIHEALIEHGLPAGLLPKQTKDFRIDDKGRFEVHLDKECNAKFENELHYEKNITGVLSYGQLADLNGILAQDLFLWFPVRRIRVDVPSSGLIYFDVDVVYKQFPLSLFDSPPDCVAAVIDGTSFTSDLDNGRHTSVIRKVVSGFVGGNSFSDFL